MKKQMNVNKNLLQLALKESQDTNIFKLSFNSNIIGKISQQSSIMTITCNCSEKTCWSLIPNKSVLVRMKMRYLKKM